MDPSKVNYLAALVAALAGFLIGGVWYSPILFARAWMREAGLKEEELHGLGKTYASALVMTAVAAINLAFFLGPDPSVTWGATAGALAGIGWVATALATIFLFERRSTTLILIDAGYLAVAYTAMGAIIGAWP
ncbi:MAG TPA: DUF1761 domain-containing protein [Kofleriaceae bacterium]|nr:DUF1761 domain-containing protein [Kofleriaceae bacterium]